VIASPSGLWYSHSVMNSASATSPATIAGHAAATLYLVSRSLDRLLEGRKLAAPLLGDSDAATRRAERGCHPDLIELVPPEKKERIGIDQVRDVIRVGQFSPVQAKRKVCLIPRSEALTPPAANALLKIMEEPPRNLMFVILAEHPSDLLPTIVSRCRILRIPPIARAVFVRHLVDAGYSKADADWLARIPLRDGDTDRLKDAHLDVAAARDAALTELRDGTIADLVSIAIGDRPIPRHEALLSLLLRIGQRDPILLTAGIRVLASQDRDTLARCLQELHATCFGLVHASHGGGTAPGALNDIIGQLGTQGIRKICLAIDDAHQSISVYTAPEAVLLSLMLTAEEDTDGE